MSESNLLNREGYTKKIGVQRFKKGLPIKPV